MTDKPEKDGSDDDRYVIFCTDGRDYGQPGYIFFTHEADVMMIAAAGEVESGKLTPAEARELLEPYREVLPPIYTGEQQMVFDPDRSGWDDPDSFPAADYVQQSPQASQIFWYKVDELGIEGVTLKWSVPFPILDLVSKTALKELKEAVSDEYKIVVKKDIDEFDAMGKSVEWARELIEDATTTEIPHTQATQMNRAGSTIELIYGHGGEGLVFLERGYAVEIRDFRNALYKAVTWGELRSMVSEERYQETFEAWKEYELDRLMDEEDNEEELEVPLPNPDEVFDAELVPGYADGDWPEFAQRAMNTWVDDEIIEEYGWYVETIFNGYYPVIAFENEEKVVSLLKKQGYICTPDADLTWDAVWGG